MIGVRFCHRCVLRFAVPGAAARGACPAVTWAVAFATVSGWLAPVGLGPAGSCASGAARCARLFLPLRSSPLPPAPRAPHPHHAAHGCAPRAAAGTAGGGRGVGLKPEGNESTEKKVALAILACSGAGGAGDETGCAGSAAEDARAWVAVGQSWDGDGARGAVVPHRRAVGFARSGRGLQKKAEM